MVRSIHTLASVAPQFGGPAYNVTRLLTALRMQGAEATMHTVRQWGGEWSPTDRSDHHHMHEQDFQAFPILGRLCFSAGMRRALLAEATSADVIHTHGLWLMPNIYAAGAGGIVGAKVMVSPRGMLSSEALKISKWRKRAFWSVLQRRALDAASCVHATSAQEVEDIRAAGVRVPVALIPNGIDLPGRLARSGKPGRRRTALSLGRLHPIKGIEHLLDAWASLEPRLPDWQVVIAGDGRASYVRSLEDRAKRLGLQNVSFVGPLEGSAKTRIFSDADLFVLPSLSENFATTVAEALSQGVPVVCTRGAPWAELDSKGCGWWVEGDVQSLAAALHKACSTPDDILRLMGERGRTWMAEAFSWSSVAGQMTDVYRWLTCGGAPPPAIQSD